MDGGAQVFGPLGIGGIDQRAHFGCSVDQVIAFALDHLQRHGSFAVKTRRAFAVFKGEANLGQIAQCNHPLAIGFHRQGVNIGHGFKTRGDFNAKAALRAFNFARGDQHVVVLHNIDQLARRYVIGFQL